VHVAVVGDPDPLGRLLLDPLGILRRQAEVLLDGRGDPRACVVVEGLHERGLPVGHADELDGVCAHVEDDLQAPVVGRHARQETDEREGCEVDRHGPYLGVLSGRDEVVHGGLLGGDDHDVSHLHRLPLGVGGLAGAEDVEVDVTALEVDRQDLPRLGMHDEVHQLLVALVGHRHRPDEDLGSAADHECGLAGGELPLLPQGRQRVSDRATVHHGAVDDRPCRQRDGGRPASRQGPPGLHLHPTDTGGTYVHPYDGAWHRPSLPVFLRETRTGPPSSVSV